LETFRRAKKKNYLYTKKVPFTLVFLQLIKSFFFKNDKKILYSYLLNTDSSTYHFSYYFLYNNREMVVLTNQFNI